MNNTEIEKEKRLYLITVIGKGVADLIEDLERFNEKIKLNKEESVQYGNLIFFISNDNVEKLSNHINLEMGEKFGFVLIDITDSLNVFDFKGHITKKHNFSDKFVNIITSFIKKEDILTNEELLEIAVDNENFEEAAKLRDKILKK